jgi:hypothetical protein
MANIGKWNAPTASATQLNTGLNALANNTMSAASATYDNSTNLNIYCDIELVLASLSPTAGAYCSVYIWCAQDGTNFPAQSDADLRLTSTQLFCTIPIGTTASTAQRVAVRNLVLPPEKVQFKLDNQTGVALNASNNNFLNLLAYNIYGNG